MQKSKCRGKEKAIPYKDRLITPEVVEESGVAEWMHELAI